MSHSADLLKIEDLQVFFPVKKGFLRSKDYVRAVDGVTFSVRRGETYALVGESGCGKTTVCKTVLGLHASTGGSIFFDEKNISNLNYSQFLPFRSRMNLIFQDPSASLNPRLKVKDLVAEPLRLLKKTMSKKEIAKAVDSVLDAVHIRHEYRNRYPHEFSGGQQQRIGIARALVVQPELIICDEPVSALDVSVQAQILNLLNDIQRQYHLTYLFISHDLSVVQFISDRIAIMYLGQIMEMGPSEKIFQTPVHPYTRALLSAAPSPSPEKTRKRIILEGDVPNPFQIPEGCRFHTRCPFTEERCRKERPELEQWSSKNGAPDAEINAEHAVRCFRKHEI